MKKLLTITLALVMVLSMTTFAFAASGSFDTDVGSITINKYNEDNIYSVYRMLDLESFDTDGLGSYAYVVNSNWTDFFTTGEGADYVTIDSAGYVTWKTGISDTVAPEFAEKALAFARANSIAPIAVSDKNLTANIGSVDGYATYKFSDLQLGYYLVDSTMGALCGLTTTNPNASINAKNGEPTIVKQVKEDSSNEWGIANTADIGQKIQYRITITVQAGAEGYILHDEMAPGLTYDNDIVVEYDGSVVTAAGNYEVKTSGMTDDCDFEVVFSDAFCNSLATGKTIVITYTGVLNENAVVAGEGNENVALLEFGEDHFTAESKVTTKTYAFDLVKTDAQNSLLDNAFFKMYRLIDGNYILADLVKVDLGGGDYYYRPAMEGETPITNGEFEVEDGIVRFQGFDPDNYYFEETAAPDGYNKLLDKAMFTLSELNKDAIFNDGVYSSGSGFHITNQSGTMLPETGGLGTVLFIVFGTIAVLGTGVLLVTKKRMSMIQD